MWTASDAAFSTSHTSTPLVRASGHAGGPKRPSASVSKSDNKRAKGLITPELFNHRTRERRCVNCGHPQLEHKSVGKMGKECPLAFVAPTQAEIDVMKGKSQA